MLSPGFAKITIPYIKGVGNSLFSGIYTSVGVPLLTFSCAKSSSVG